MVPAVGLQYPLVVPRKAAGRLRLPEDARAGPDEVVVKQALVEAALPPLRVEHLQRLPAGGP
jgi:hypothetical protein